MGSSLQAEILARLDEAPDSRCLGFYRSGEAVRWRSRREVWQHAAAVAEMLRDRGLRPRDVAVIALPSGETAAILVIATLLVGAVPLLVAPPALVGGNREVYETLRSTLRRTSARLAICASTLAAELGRLQRSAPGTRVILAGAVRPPDGIAGTFTPYLPYAGEIAAMQLTSGTTAAPRICVWDHRGVGAALDGMADAMALSPDDVCVNWTPLYHDMGLVNNFLLCLTHGVPLVLLSPQEFIRRPAIWLRALSDSGATLTWSPNFGFAVAARRAADSELTNVRLDGVRAFWNAAERIHFETFDLFYRRFATLGLRREALKTNYGCAENIGGATFSAVDRAARHERIDRQRLDVEGIARETTDGGDTGAVSIVSVGRPNRGLDVRILSRRGSMLPDGHVGEICLDTPSRMLRYHDNARATARAIRGALLHTGDVGYMRRGELFWVGRVRERITVHGKKIDPSAFEAVLLSIHGLRDGCFVAFGIADQALGTERVVVVSEVRLPLTESPDQTCAAVRKGCFLWLGFAPDDVVLVRPGTLAKTSSGKRRHRHFRKLYLAGGLEVHRIVPDSIHPAVAPMIATAAAERG